MQMVDGVILLVCAVEGPMTQTRFVLKKALKQGLKPIVIINKADRPNSRIKEVENEVFDLFCDLDIKEENMEYPVFYASGKVTVWCYIFKDGWAVSNPEDMKNGKRKDLRSIFDAIVESIPFPR